MPKKRKYSENFFRCFLFLIGLYLNASESDLPIFERIKQNTKFFMSEEIGSLFSRFSLATDRKI